MQCSLQAAPLITSRATSADRFRPRVQTAVGAAKRRLISGTMEQDSHEYTPKEGGVHNHTRENPTTQRRSIHNIIRIRSVHLGLFWKLVTRARDLHGSETTTIYTVVDARKRLKDFPANYFGNCIFVRPAVCKVEDVLDMPLGHLAKLIHDSVGVVTDEYVRSIVDFIHVTGAEKLAWDRPHLATYDLQPTFWRFFPIYELDFGFGVPSYGGRNSPTLGSAGFAAVSPTPAKDRSVLISQFLYSDVADKLEKMLVV